MSSLKDNLIHAVLSRAAYDETDDVDERAARLYIDALTYNESLEALQSILIFAAQRAVAYDPRLSWMRDVIADLPRLAEEDVVRLSAREEFKIEWPPLSRLMLALDWVMQGTTLRTREHRWRELFAWAVVQVAVSVFDLAFALRYPEEFSNWQKIMRMSEAEMNEHTLPVYRPVCYDPCWEEVKACLSTLKDV